MTDVKKRFSLKGKAQATQSAARQRVIERGIVQFRADPELVELLLTVSDYKRMPTGVMVRAWVVERLRKEAREME